MPIRISQLPAAELPLDEADLVVVNQANITCVAPVSAFGSGGQGVDVGVFETTLDFNINDSTILDNFSTRLPSTSTSLVTTGYFSSTIGLNASNTYKVTLCVDLTQTDSYGNPTTWNSGVSMFGSECSLDLGEVLGAGSCVHTVGSATESENQNVTSFFGTQYNTRRSFTDTYIVQTPALAEGEFDTLFFHLFQAGYGTDHSTINAQVVCTVEYLGNYIPV